MEKTQIEYFKKILAQQLKELTEHNEDAISDLEEMKNEYPDPLDRAIVERNRSFFLRIRRRERNLTKKIEDALERIDKGLYGICIACGEEIPAARLKARPFAMYCVDCKAKSES